MAGSIEAHLRQLEHNVRASKKNANDLVELLASMDGNDQPGHQLTALNCLRRIFIAFARRGDLHAIATKVDADSAGVTSKKEALRKNKQVQTKFRLWMRARYLQFIKALSLALSFKGSTTVARQTRVASMRTLMEFVKLSRYMQREKDMQGYHFGNDIYIRILKHLLHSDKMDQELVDLLVEEYLVFNDVQLYTLKNLKLLLDRFKTTNQAKAPVVQNAFNLLLHIRLPSRQEQLSNMFIPAADNSYNRLASGVAGPQKKRKRKAAKDAQATMHSVQKMSTYKRAHEGCWLSLLRSDMPKAVFKEALLKLPSRALPHMEHPVLLCDFLSDAFNTGGVISLLALEGLFGLMQKHSIEYPQFYVKLYSMLAPSIFLVKYRERFYKLLNLCLNSTHLPSYLVAAFLKRLGRLCLTAPPAGALFVIPLMYNMLKRHPQCESLVQKGKFGVATKSTADPYDVVEPDLKKTRAMESSLWELDALRKHYCPSVATMASAFETQNKQKYSISDFTAVSYTSLFSQSIKRGLRSKHAPALMYEYVDPLMKL